jgi:hypothetical protein
MQRLRRPISALWIAGGILLLATTAVDLVKVSGDASLRSSWALLLVAPFLVFGVAAIRLGFLLWRGSSVAHRSGTALSVIGSIVLALLFLSNLVLGIGVRQPIHLIGAALCAAGIWFCYLSFRLARSAK